MMIKKVTTILKLIKNVIYRHRKYTLGFYSKGMKAGQDTIWKIWYYDFNNWGFPEGHLMMVSGADKLCELYSKDGKYCKVDILATRHHPQLAGIGYDIYKRQPLAKGLLNRILCGATYDNGKNTFWICPVTLFVLGRYPKYISIRNSAF